MNDIEKVNEHYGNTMRENVIEWLRDSKTASVTLSQGKYITKVKKLAEKFPEEVKIIAENKDGSIVAHIPTRCIKINYVVRDIDEDMKEQLKENLAKARNAKQK